MRDRLHVGEEGGGEEEIIDALCSDNGSPRVIARLAACASLHGT